MPLGLPAPERDWGRPTSGFRVRDARLVDGPGGAVRERVAILVRDGRIAGIGLEWMAAP
jgi:hypothetical protein